MNMLEKEIQKAIDECRWCDFYTGSESYSGYPIELDAQFVKIVCLGLSKTPKVSSVWILRLDSIDGFCPIDNTWDLERLYRTLEQEPPSLEVAKTETGPESDDDEPPATAVTI